MSKRLKRWWFDQSGATAIEYGLIAALIVVVIIGGVKLFATNAVSMFDYINTTITVVLS